MPRLPYLLLYLGLRSWDFFLFRNLVKVFFRSETYLLFPRGLVNRQLQVSARITDQTRRTGRNLTLQYLFWFEYRPTCKWTMVGHNEYVSQWEKTLTKFLKTKKSQDLRPRSITRSRDNIWSVCRRGNDWRQNMGEIGEMCLKPTLPCHGSPDRETARQNQRK